MQMRTFAAISLLSISTFTAHGQKRTPKMTSTDTPNGKKGEVVAFSGENLGATTLLKVYLTDGKHDFQIVFAEQTSMSMKFRIPEKVHAGRFAFMALTAGDDGRFVELPRFRVTIDQYGAFQVQDTEKATRATCAAVYRNTADKKVSDLTVKEGQQVRACQAVGLYPPQ